jgi:hypothetical protein
MSAARFDFQACSFNHSDISPLLESTTSRVDRRLSELCQTSQRGAITYGCPIPPTLGQETSGF